MCCFKRKTWRPEVRRADFHTVWAGLEGLAEERHLYDGEFYYTSLTDWKRIIAEIASELPRPGDVPPDVQDALDCDDYAMMMHGEILRRYHLNGCGHIIGSSPAGPHAFNIIWTDGGPYFVEPQTGELWPADCEIGNPSGYLAKEIYMG